jgi:hypothetical protein
MGYLVSGMVWSSYRVRAGEIPTVGEGVGEVVREAFGSSTFWSYSWKDVSSLKRAGSSRKRPWSREVVDICVFMGG